MCGIVAAVADRNIVPILIEGLRKLEYRGYDSAGLAVHNGGMHRLRTVGRVAELATRAEGLTAGAGIAHTRWATHGVPSERNAHPHVSGDLAVVHNGIIENYVEIKRPPGRAGYAFTSDTDTEVIAHLIEHKLRSQARPARRRARRLRRTGRRLRHRRALGEGAAARGRRAARRAAAAGPGRGWPLRRLGCRGAAAGDAHPDLPRGRRHRRDRPRRRAHRARRRHAGRPPEARKHALGGCRRARQVPALHAEGNLRAAAGAGQHPGDDRRGAFRRAAIVRRRRGGNAGRRQERAHPRLRHQLSCRPDGALLDRAARRPALQRGDRQRIPLPRLACRIRRRWSSPSRNPARPPTRWPP